MGVSTDVVDHPLPKEAVTCTVPVGGECLARSLALVTEASAWGSLYVCAARPMPSSPGDAGTEEENPEAVAALAAAMSRIPAERGQVIAGPTWTIEVRASPCPAPPPAALEGGVDAAVSD